ncbi:hypothetical protein ACP6C3_13300 [Mycolicibacterium septicum]
MAVQLRGGTVTGITLRPGQVTYRLPRERKRFFVNGVRTDEPVTDRLPESYGFVAYAGCWASVRSRKPLSANGFTNLVLAELASNPTDFESFNDCAPLAHWLDSWNQELENAWPDIKVLAQRLVNAHAAQSDSKSFSGQRVDIVNE